MVFTRSQRRKEQTDLERALALSTRPQPRNIQHLVRRRYEMHPDVLQALMDLPSSQSTRASSVASMPLSQSSLPDISLDNMPSENNDWPRYKDTDDTHRHRLDDTEPKSEVVQSYVRRDAGDRSRRKPYYWRR